MKFTLRDWKLIKRPKRTCANTELLHRGARRREEILDFVLTYQEQNGYGPCIREIGAAVGLKSSSTVWMHLTKLQEEGRVAREARKPRCVALTKSDTDYVARIERLLALVVARVPHEEIELAIREAIGGES